MGKAMDQNNKNDNRQKKKIRFDQGCILAVVLYFLLAGLLYFAAGTQLYERTADRKSVV